MKDKRVVIITGAANGIGKATALKFAAARYAVALVDIDGRGLKQLTPALDCIGADHLFIEGDLQDSDFLRRIVDTTADKWGRIDALINNAAWRTLETMRSISIENWEKTIKINLTAPAFLARHVAAVMEKRHTPGVIINVSSVMSQRAGGTSPAYVTCKGAIDSLTYELATLYGPGGIRVIAINPGNVDTNLSNDFTDEKGNNISRQLVDQMNNSTPLQRSASADEIAKVALWLCSADASFVTGTSILVDGGFFHNFNSYPMKKLQFPNEF